MQYRGAFSSFADSVSDWGKCFRFGAPISPSISAALSFFLLLQVQWAKAWCHCNASNEKKLKYFPHFWGECISALKITHWWMMLPWSSSVVYL